MDSIKIDGANINLFFTFSKYLIFFLKRVAKKFDNFERKCRMFRFDAI